LKQWVTESSQRRAMEALPFIHEKERAIKLGDFAHGGMKRLIKPQLSLDLPVTKQA